tara:strand:- start:18 stop:308 length:291 start_codon:yes stop_codon:yes gene_type:complete
LSFKENEPKSSKVSELIIVLSKSIIRENFEHIYFLITDQKVVSVPLKILKIFSLCFIVIKIDKIDIDIMKFEDNSGQKKYENNGTKIRVIIVAAAT